MSWKRKQGRIEEKLKKRMKEERGCKERRKEEMSY